MRCVACNKNLSDFESTRKIVRENDSVSYPDLCNCCFKESGIRNFVQVIERNDIPHEEYVDE